MTSFKFPPPPPPPPKAPSNDTQNTYNSQRGNSNRGRGDRGHGRGGAGRGRGHFSGSARGGHGQGGKSGHAPTRGSSRGGHQHQNKGRGGWANGGSVNVPPPYQSRQIAPQSPSVPHIPSTPANANENPLPESLSLSGAQTPSVDPATLAQAMSFMSTPAGMQSMMAFASHMAGVNATSSAPQSPPPHLYPSQGHQSSPTSGINKRKRDQRMSQYEAQQKQRVGDSAQQTDKKPQRAKAKAAPAIPAFGFSLPSLSASQSPSLSKRNDDSNRNKRKVNLGLTHRDNTESSEEEDIDEEAEFATKYKVESTVFEHNGESISLQTPAEVAAWIKDRKKQYPTQKRIMEKAQEASAKRASELEFLHRITGRTGKGHDDAQQHSISRPARDDKMTPLTKRVELTEIRKVVQDSMPKGGAATFGKQVAQAPRADNKPQAFNLGLGYDTESDEDNSSILSDSSVVSTSEDDDSDPESDSENSDMAPETQSSKVAVAPIVTRPPRIVPQVRKERSKICDHWKHSGKCKFGDRCKYDHPSKGTKERKRVGLYERMVEQELEKADRLALDAIKYLGRNGFLG